MKENNQEQAIVKTSTDIVFTGDMANDYNIAKTFIQSKFFTDLSTASQAMVKIQAGRELGLQPFASMQGLFIVKGKIMIAGNIIAGKIKAHPRYDYKIRKLDDSICEIEFFENGEKVGSYSFSYEKAKKIGLTSNSVWQNYPQTMLFNRAISGGYKIFCPDIFTFSVYTEADDIQAMSETVTVADAIQQELANNIDEVNVANINDQIDTTTGEVVEEKENQIYEESSEDQYQEAAQTLIQRPQDSPEEAMIRRKTTEDIDRVREIQNKVQSTILKQKRRVQ